MEKIKRLDETVWPRKVRMAVNACIDWVNRPWEVVYNKVPVTSAKVLFSREKVTIILPFFPLAGSSGVPVVSLEPVPTTSGGDQALFITFGTFGQNAEVSTGASVPTIGGVSIAATGGGRPKLVLGGDEQCVYLAVGLDGDKKVTGVTVQSSTDDAPPDPDDSNAYVLLGSISFGDDGKVSVDRNLSGSQSYSYCNGHLWGLA